MKTNRDALLNAAVEVFHESGFDAARVSDIVARAGVSQGTFYLYFDSKQDAFTGLLDRFAVQVRATFVTVDWHAMETLADFEKQFTELYTQFFVLADRQRPEADLLLNHAPAVGGAAAEILATLMTQAELLTTQYFREGMALGYIRDINAEVLGRAVVGLIIQVANRTVVLGKQSSNLRDLASDLIQFELWGAALRPDTPSR